MRHAVALLFASAVAVSAQPVTFNASVEFTSPQNTTSINTITYGSAPNTLALEFLPAPASTSDPTADHYSYSTFGQIRATLSGNPALIPLMPRFAAPNFRLIVSLPGTSLSGSISGTISYVAEGSTYVLRLNVARTGSSSLTTINGVHYSIRGSAIPLFFSAGPSIVLTDLPARLTRGGITFSPASASVFLVTPDTYTRTIIVNTIDGELFEGGFATDFVVASVAGPNLGSLFVSSSNYGISGLFQMPFSSAGVPTAYFPFTISYPLQTTDTITLSPPTVNFFHTPGAALPPDQFVNVTATGDIAYTAAYFDTSWLQVPNPRGTANHPVNGVLRLHPLLETKPVGEHHTSLRVSSDHSFVTATLNLNYYVSAGPRLNATVLPPEGGTIRYSAPIVNNGATTLQLTAEARPGYSFRRWTGSQETAVNPLTVMLTQPVNATAIFDGPAPCTYDVGPVRLGAPALGDMGRIRITTQAWCSWSAALPAPSDWLVLVNNGGMGTADVTYLVQPNRTDMLRTVSFTVAGRFVTIEQAPQACGTLLPQPMPTLPASGGLVTTTVTADAGCSYTIFGSQDWLVTPKISFSANSSPLTEVIANGTSRPRTASLNIAGLRVPVIQSPPVPLQPYSDVIAGSVFADHIALLNVLGVAEACEAGRFCPNAPITRAQMALLVVRSVLGMDTFSFRAQAYFPDVPSAHPYFKYVQKMAELGITEGCNDGAFYCPDEAVTRGQMAKFLQRARNPTNPSAGPGPFNGRPYFRDVGTANPFFQSIQKMREWGITVGCNATDYCPNDTTTREQMAAFVVRAFFTP